MNNELLKLFDIKDDVVKTFTVDHKESNYEIDIRFKPSRFSCPTCGSTHFISKGNKKRSLVSVPVNDKPVKMITYVKRYNHGDEEEGNENVPIKNSHGVDEKLAHAGPGEY